MSAFVPNERIIAEAYRFARDDLGPTKPGQCLAFVRQVIESACDLAPYDLYRHYVTERVPTSAETQGNERAPWARDAERSLRNLGMAVHDIRPGDIVFDHRAAFSRYWGAHVGHVAIYLPHRLILENVDPAYRPVSFTREPLALTPFDTWGTDGKPTTVIRFDPGKRAGRNVL